MFVIEIHIYFNNTVYIKTPEKNDAICILHGSEMMMLSLSGGIVLKGKYLYHGQSFFSRIIDLQHSVSSRYTTK